MPSMDFLRVLIVIIAFGAGYIIARMQNLESTKVVARSMSSVQSASAFVRRKTLAELADKYKPSKFTLSHCSYQRFYPTIFEPYRDKEFKMLEIGIDTGSGSLLWKEYFPLVDLWGMDINEETLNTKGGQSISMVIGSQSNQTFLEKEFLTITGGEFDIIIDDGGHHYEQQALSYQVLFEKALKPGGWYIIEDIETSFWEKGQELYGSGITRGGCESQDTMLRAMQRLTEVVNKKFIDNDKTVFGSVDHWVKSITFGSNIVMLQKKDEQDCYSENLYTWPEFLSKDCPSSLQANDSIYPPEKFTLHAFCSTASEKK